jgi:hypothetical protein
MIMQISIRNLIIIYDIINRLDINISFLLVYRISIKNYIKYQLFIAFIRNFQIDKLRKIAANRKNARKE